jgi:hypothetical protein
MSLDQETRFCHYEEQRFPADEFEQTERNGWVHDRSPRHTVAGTLLKEGEPKDKKPGKEKIPGPMRMA